MVRYILLWWFSVLVLEVIIELCSHAEGDFDFDIQRAWLTPGNSKRSQGRTCGLRCIGLDFGSSHGFSITSIKSLSLAEHAKLLAKHATGPTIGLTAVIR
jgi:hypothetical protein